MSKPQISENTSIWLNAIRGVSAQIVVISHAFQIFYSGQYVPLDNPVGNIFYTFLITIAPLAQQAVVAFFVISGWLVGGNILRDIVGQRFDLRKYTIDRTTRLWIVLIPALVVTMALDLGAIHLGAGTSIITSRTPFYPTWWDQVDPWSLKTFLSNAFFLQMITSWQLGTNLSLWSLSNEFWYYCLFPSILGICLAPGKKIKLICLFAAIAIISLFLGSAKLSSGRQLSYIVYFLIWSLAAFEAWVSWRTAAVSISAIALFLAAIFATTGGLELMPTFKSDSYTTVFILLFLLLSSKMPGHLISRPARFFSSYSYSLYVIHLPVLVFLMSFDPALFNRVSFSIATLVRFVIYLAIVNLVAFGFSMLTERNTARLRVAISPTEA